MYTLLALDYRYESIWLDDDVLLDVKVEVRFFLHLLDFKRFIQIKISPFPAS